MARAFPPTASVLTRCATRPWCDMLMAMRVRRTHKAGWLAAALVILTAAALTASVVVADRGPGFSFAGSDAVGQVALVTPVVTCLLAAVAQIWRRPDRW